MSKKLVAYFSASGVTAKVAETLAEAIGADIFEIEPKVPYTEADLNWMDKKARSTIEMNDPASRPEIAVKRDNMKDYDTIFVGFPIWWYVAPTMLSEKRMGRFLSSMFVSRTSSAAKSTASILHLMPSTFSVAPTGM